MTIFRLELRRGRNTFWIWTAAIAGFMMLCLFLFPEMEKEMTSISDAFASMGTFTAAFGMDKLNFGELMGFYGIECGNILGIGGAFFAALLGIAVLAKEEGEHTADFLLTHPVSRMRVSGEKLAAVMAQLIAMNVILFFCVVGSIYAIGETPSWRELALLHTAYLLLQVEIAALCFGISAFLKRGGMGLGLGIAAALYFLNLVANITDSAAFLKNITPFGYAEAADILTQSTLDCSRLAIGGAITVTALAVGLLHYRRKDIV